MPNQILLDAFCIIETRVRLEIWMDRLWDGLIANNRCKSEYSVSSFDIKSRAANSSDAMALLIAGRCSNADATGP